MIHQFQLIHVAVVDNTGITLSSADAKVIDTEVKRMEEELLALRKQNGIYKGHMKTIKAEAVKLYPDNSVFRSCVEGIE